MRTSTTADASAIRSGISQPGGELGGRRSRATGRSPIRSSRPANVAARASGIGSDSGSRAAVITANAPLPAASDSASPRRRDRNPYASANAVCEREPANTPAAVAAPNAAPCSIETKSTTGPLGYEVTVPAFVPSHRWRECRLEDRDGYMFAVGKPVS